MVFQFIHLECIFYQGVVPVVIAVLASDVVAGGVNLDADASVHLAYVCLELDRENLPWLQGAGEQALLFFGVKQAYVDASAFEICGAGLVVAVLEFSLPGFYQQAAIGKGLTETVFDKEPQAAVELSAFQGGGDASAGLYAHCLGVSPLGRVELGGFELRRPGADSIGSGGEAEALRRIAEPAIINSTGV